MQENIIWLVNSMVDLGDQDVINICSQNNIVFIIAEQISADKKEHVRGLNEFIIHPIDATIDSKHSDYFV